MQFLLTEADFVGAPKEVLDWVHSRIDVFCAKEWEVKEPLQLTEPKGEPDEEVETEDLPGLEEVMEAAVNLVKDKGEDCLAGILKDMGVSRVRDCPAEHLIELLTRIATEMD